MYEDITFQDLLGILEISKGENNLLLGNGFNLSLRIDTSYKNIMEVMQQKHSLYKNEEFKGLVKKNNYNIEKIIGELTKKEKKEDTFLKKFIADKIKLDFMQSTNQIVSGHIINKVYRESKKGLYRLLKNCTNYFSLNYDLVLYLLLMKYKKPDTLTKQEKEEIDQIIELNREKGTISFKGNIKDNIVKMSALEKREFFNILKIYLKHLGKDNLIKELENLLFWKGENTQQGNLDDINDGFHLSENEEEKEYSFRITAEQNLFFLHGAFHFYKKEGDIFKATRKENKSLYQRLKNIISNRGEDLFCVFKDDGKLDDIKKNEYLDHCYEKLKTLKGSMIIIGCSFSENDGHIVDAINESDIENIYISYYFDSK